MNAQTCHPIAKALIEMGYQPDLIPPALSGSEHKSLEEVLDILFLLPKDPRQLKSLFRDQKEEEQKISEAFTMKATQLQNEKLHLQRESQKVQVLTQTSKDRLKMYFKITVENLQGIRSHNANDFITKLMMCLEEIKASFDKLGLTSREFFGLLHDQRLSAKVKNKVFDVINKILTMNSEYKIKLEKLDELLLMTFKMNLVTRKQKDAILESYRDLYKRKKHYLNQKFIETLMKVYNENSDAEYVPSIENLELLDQKGSIHDDFPINGISRGFEESKVNEKIAESVDVHCIICMKDLKKIVFLPCSHFLTCPSCAKKVLKCPMCNKTIEKQQKIFWS